MSARIRVLLISVAAVSMLAPIGAAQARPHPKPKPNLVVKGVSFQSSPAESNSKKFPFVVLESDRRGQFGLTFTVKNTGKGRAPRSDAEIVVSGKHYKNEPVGALAPGKATKIIAVYHPHFRNPGLFDVSVCVGDHQCSPPIKFSAVIRRWNVTSWTSGPGSLTGIAPFFSSNSEGMTLDFYGPVREGDDISYTWLANGGVAGSVSGNDGTCNYTGSGSTSHAPWDVVDPAIGYMVMTTDLSGYFAEVKDQDYTFSVTQSCPGYPDYNSTSNIFALETLDYPEGRVDHTMEPESTSLRGDYSIPTGFGSGSGNGQWSFTADFP